MTLASAGDKAACTVVPLEAARRTRLATLAVVTDRAVVAAAGAEGADLWWSGSDGMAMRAADPGVAARVRTAGCAHDDAVLGELAGMAVELSGGGDGQAWLAARRADAAGIITVNAPRVRYLAACLARAGTLSCDEISGILGAVPAAGESGWEA